MSIAFLPDLRGSQELQCCITIMTPDREYRYTSVRDLNEEDGYVVVFTPKTMGGDTTTTTLFLSEVVSVQLHPNMPS